MKKIIYVCLTFLMLCCTSCDNTNATKNKVLLLYCGITMVNPMTEIINNFTKENPKVKIIVSQGGSQDLYNSLKSSRKGDLYLPGSASYRKDNIKDGLLGDAALVGYNQAALVVKKGNPKHFTADIRELATTKLSIGICNANSGSIGRMTKEILESMDIYKDVFNKAAILSTDSRNLTKAVKDGMADVVLNWKATAYWPGK